MVGWHTLLNGNEFEQTPGAWHATVRGDAKSQTEQQRREMTRILGMQDELSIEFLHREAKGRKNERGHPR